MSQSTHYKIISACDYKYSDTLTDITPDLGADDSTSADDIELDLGAPVTLTLPTTVRPGPINRAPPVSPVGPLLRRRPRGQGCYEGSRRADPTALTHFLWCVHGQYHIQSCPRGTVYCSPDTGCCNRAGRQPYHDHGDFSFLESARDRLHGLRSLHGIQALTSALGLGGGRGLNSLEGGRGLNGLGGRRGLNGLLGNALLSNVNQFFQAGLLPGAGLFAQARLPTPLVTLPDQATSIFDPIGNTLSSPSPVVFRASDAQIPVALTATERNNANDVIFTTAGNDVENNVDVITANQNPVNEAVDVNQVISATANIDSEPRTVDVNGVNSGNVVIDIQSSNPTDTDSTMLVETASPMFREPLRTDPGLFSFQTLPAPVPPSTQSSRSRMNTFQPVSMDDLMAQMMRMVASREQRADMTRARNGISVITANGATDGGQPEADSVSTDDVDGTQPGDDLLPGSVIRVSPITSREGGNGMTSLPGSVEDMEGVISVNPGEMIPLTQRMGLVSDGNIEGVSDNSDGEGGSQSEESSTTEGKSFSVGGQTFRINITFDVPDEDNR